MQKNNSHYKDGCEIEYFGFLLKFVDMSRIGRKFGKKKINMLNEDYVGLWSFFVIDLRNWGHDEADETV